jgi:type I restriction enzyme R subunit
MPPRIAELAFEIAIERHLLGHGFISVKPEGFDRARAIFPEVVLAFIRETQPMEWAKLEALHGAKTGEQILTDLCKWMDTGLTVTRASPSSSSSAGRWFISLWTPNRCL